ncbi:Aste57867_20700 [Aphanomyces stellatus]|uniref:Aste57867_20700 protein n=1 Tax=Aphanomyces stellatus TaxID=120398 RepID=A0A485LKB0_9STRA|nr:hypothetical protein As57867_020632 [Aphanomyces stellatus]VFT97380.1 Aste57867_20700 [Aphanomyces stellatus]
MSASTSSANRNESYLQDQIRALQVQGDYYARKVEIEKRRGEELDVQIKVAVQQYRDTHNETKKLMSPTGGMGTSTPAKPPSADAAVDPRSIRTLENRLEKVLIRLNEACNANKRLREQIQNLRREKVQQQQIHEKLDRELHAKHLEVTKTGQMTQNIYDARDRAQRQVEALRLQTADETARFEAEWNDLKDVIEVDRAHLRASQHHGASSMYMDGDDDDNGRESGTPDAKLRDETLKTSWLISAKEADLRKQAERLKAYEDGLAKIRKKTGIKDIGELANALMAAEEKNFSLFNMINELNTEMEAVEIENNRFQEMIDECKGSGSDLNRARIKASLEEQIEKSKQKAAHFEAKVGESMAVIDSIKTGAMNIFHKIGYNDEVLVQQLNSTGLTDINMLKFLGIIEKRVGEIVQMHNIVYTQSGGGKLDLLDASSSSSASAAAAHKTSKKAVAASHELHPTPPGADDFLDDDADDPEEDVKPATIAEIQERTAAAIGRRKDKPKKR